jgi:hypothetical protein
MELYEDISLEKLPQGSSQLNHIESCRTRPAKCAGSSWTNIVNIYQSRHCNTLLYCALAYNIVYFVSDRRYSNAFHLYPRTSPTPAITITSAMPGLSTSHVAQVMAARTTEVETALWTMNVITKPYLILSVIFGLMSLALLIRNLLYRRVSLRQYLLRSENCLILWMSWPLHVQAIYESFKRRGGYQNVERGKEGIEAQSSFGPDVIRSQPSRLNVAPTFTPQALHGPVAQTYKIASAPPLPRSKRTSLVSQSTDSTIFRRKNSSPESISPIQMPTPPANVSPLTLPPSAHFVYGSNVVGRENNGHLGTERKWMGSKEKDAASIPLPDSPVMEDGKKFEEVAL